VKARKYSGYRELNHAICCLVVLGILYKNRPNEKKIILCATFPRVSSRNKYSLKISIVIKPHWKRSGVKALCPIVDMELTFLFLEKKNYINK